ncbi:RidA family protein [Kiloniella antarctica]|uniref:RidA family protein n=1 Tax=Kiloniella antarctica TaxID=1550907 RepID=A0ABW5BQ08_9PROT
MTTITRIDPGSRMSQAVIHNETIYLAGQVGVPGESAAAQTATILSNIDNLLKKAGSDKTKILQTTIWLASMDDFQEMNTVWDAWVDLKNPPTRACGEAKLATPDYLVEIIIVAAL